MVKKRGKTLLILLFIIIALVFLVLFLNQNLHQHKVKITIEESKIYQKKEIESAIDIVLEKFKEFPGTLEEIWYQDKKDAFNSWAVDYGKEEAIILYSNFVTDNKDYKKMQGFEPNERYENWMWILVRNHGEDWTLKTWGWG